LRRSGLLIGRGGSLRSRFDILLGSEFWLHVGDVVFETGERHVGLEHRARNLHTHLVPAHRIEEKKDTQSECPIEPSSCLRMTYLPLLLPNQKTL
jgi:hypothetical protein